MEVKINITIHIIQICLQFLYISLSSSPVNYNINTNLYQEEYNNCQPYRNTTQFGEFLVDTSYITAPEVNNLDLPVISFDGTNYLIVWLDNRFMPAYYSIYGVRINRDGVIIDTGGIPICTIASTKYFPAVTFGGSCYLVVWQDNRNANEEDIYGARITTNGIVMDPQGFPICTNASPQFDPNVAYDGNNFFVVWTDTRNGNGDIYGTRLTPSGSILDPQGIPISIAPRMQGDVEIAFDGVNYFVIWDDERNFPTNDFDIYGTLISTDGIVFDTLGIPVCTARGGQGPSAIIFGGNNYFAIWNDDRINPDSSSIYGTRISTQGTVLDPNGIFVGNVNNQWYWFISIAFDGFNYFATWQGWTSTTSFNIYGARINQSGIVLDTNEIPIANRIGFEFNPSIAFDGQNYLETWYGEADTLPFSAIFYRRITQSGTLPDSTEKIVSITASRQGRPAISWSGSNYFVVWDDERGNAFENLRMKDLYGIRISPTGAIIDPQPILLAGGDYYQIFPAIAFDGSNFLITYDSGALGIYDIYGIRINQSGVILDTTKIPLAVANGSQQYSALEFDGANYLCLWQDNRMYNYDIYGCRISPAGQILDTVPLIISRANLDQQYPALIYGGTNYFAVWQDGRMNYVNIYGCRISPTGQVLDTAGIAITNLNRNQTNPAVAFDGVNYLVVWQDIRNNINYICAARINQLGILIDSNAIDVSLIPSNQVEPTVTFDGANYVVVWQDSRSGNYQEDLYGALINPSGVVIDTFAVSRQIGRQILPALCRSNGSQVLTVYAGWTDSINQHSAQSMRIWGKLLHPPYGNWERTQDVIDPGWIRFELFPNPMKRAAGLRYDLPHETRIKISVYDVTGRLVKKICDERQKKGRYQTVLDLSDLAQGVYFVYLAADNQSIVRKITVLK